MAKTFQCILLTPEESVLDARVTYAVIPAWDGLMGLAPQRAAMVVKLGDGPLRLDLADGESQWYFVGGGFAQMRGDTLTLLTDEVMPSNEIDAKQAAAAFEEATARKAEDLLSLDRKERALTKARALMSLAGR